MSCVTNTTVFELALQPDGLGLELGPHDRVHRAERLVHEQDVRVRGERPRHPDALLLAPESWLG